MKENLINTGGCIQNNCLDVFCIAVHCIIKVSEIGPSWPSCFKRRLLQRRPKASVCGKGLILQNSIDIYIHVSYNIMVHSFSKRIKQNVGID